MCDIRLCYRYRKDPGYYQKLSLLQSYLRELGLESKLGEDVHYGPCWTLECKATVELEVAEQIYEYCDSHNFAIEFLYRPGGIYYLIDR